MIFARDDYKISFLIYFQCQLSFINLITSIYRLNFVIYIVVSSPFQSKLMSKLTEFRKQIITKITKRANLILQLKHNFVY